MSGIGSRLHGSFLWLKVALLCFGGGMGLACGQEFCSLVVRVQPTGQNRMKIPVRVFEKSGRITVNETSGGEVRVCDLGLSSVTVVVGGKGCKQVTVDDVPVGWGFNGELTVTYDATGCDSGGHGHRPPVAACQMLFRFVSGADTPVSGVLLTEDGPTKETHKADQFGRVVVAIVAGGSFNALAEAAGRKPMKVSLACTRENMRAERTIQMLPE
jgi:hypothetical protein